MKTLVSVWNRQKVKNRIILQSRVVIESHGSFHFEFRFASTSSKASLAQSKSLSFFLICWHCLIVDDQWHTEEKRTEILISQVPNIACNYDLLQQRWISSQFWPSLVVNPSTYEGLILHYDPHRHSIFIYMRPFVKFVTIVHYELFSW